ncbi:hypothetical protein LJR030_001346 [Rhizobium sp. LjRoot30]|uniref:O-linked N-acetylglucosamine transferase, SPINDLY family protein n=1 Tax=Rhizobium sp. LjRoot30 TaxID=3342320 RepID=UPI003ECD563C
MASLLDKAKQQYNRGDYKIALATLRRLIQQERRNADAHILTATIHEQQDNRELAADFYASAVPLTANLKREVGFRAASHYLAVGRSEKALSTLLAVHGFFPDDPGVNHSICSILREAGRYDEAAPFAVKLASVGNGFENALNAGIVLSGLGRYEDAYPALLKSQQERPDERLAVSELFWCASNLCDFPVADAMQAKLEAAYAAEGDNADIRENAFRALTWSGDEAYHARTARLTAKTLLPPVAPKAASVEPVPGNRRIRIGYLSSDFRDHPAMTFIGGVLEAHDRDAFEVFAFCHTPESHRQGPMREKFLANIEHFVDIRPLDDNQSAELIRSKNIDLLVDLQGFTSGSRVGIFCRRPAPRQVTYFGTPGSVQGAGIDYAITDEIITPDSSQPHYEESLLRLPRNYFCYASPSGRVEREGERGDHGLPETGVVFSSFNQAQKIRSNVFAAWMQILRQVDGSVLWLLEQLPAIQNNLRKHAADAGVDPARIVFAPRVSMSAHLPRLAQADIGLDTAPYNGHTTTADALWSGVPVLTWKGTSFASRVSESLLRSVGLPELVAEDLNGFVRLAVELAQDGARLSRLRQHLFAARDTAPVFDTVGTTRAIEAHFERICRA